MECNELAPGLTADSQTAGESDYYDLTAEPTGNIAGADTLRRELTGRWRGTLISVTCDGSYKNPHKNQQQYTIDAEIETLYDGDIRIETEKESSRAVNLEKVFLSLKRSQSVTTDGENTWTFIEKYRVNNSRPATLAISGQLGNGGHGLLVHQIKKVVLNNRSFNLSRLIYVNGHLVAQDGWLLQRS